MRALAATLSGLLLLAPAAGRAGLGAPHGSVETDRRALGGEPRPATPGRGYTVESYDLRGTTVREYVGADGAVFAVAWEGLTHPDLATLLGAHARAWREAVAAAPRSPSRAHRRVVAGAAIVETWGHMRHLRGRAWLPALLPQGVGEDELQ